MRKPISAFFFLCFFFSSQYLMALPIEGTDVKIYAGEYRSNSFSGGEFIVEAQTAEQQKWIGFCLELNEFLSFGPLFDINNVSQYAESGGKGGQNPTNSGKDPLSQESKWLYYMYVFGNEPWSRGQGALLADKQTRNSNFQNVLWFLEDEKAFSDLNAEAQSLYNTAITGRTSFTIPNGVAIAVLNINTTDGNYTRSQSLLIGEQNPVPEPATLLLFGSGMLGLAGLRFRRRTQAK